MIWDGMDNMYILHTSIMCEIKPIGKTQDEVETWSTHVQKISTWWCP